MVCATAPARTARAGRLKEGALLELLRELFAERATGVLHLARNGRGLSLRLVNGHVVSGSSGEPSRIGDILVRCGSLSRADLERALVNARSEGRRLGPVLVDLGLVDRERLEDALRLQVRDVLFTGLAWHDAEWELAADDAPTPLPEDATLRLSTPQLLLEAEHRIAEPEAVRRALGDLDLPLAAVGEPPSRLQGAALGPADGFVLSRVDGTLTARQILEIAPLPDDEVARSLVTLLSAGVIERRAARPQAGPAARAAVSDPPPVAEPARTARPAQRRPAAPADLRRDIEQAFAGLARKSHFEVLGIERSASPDEVKAAYQSLVRRFHPDALGEVASAEADLEEKARAVFVRVTEAYRGLRATGARSRHEERLGRAPREASLFAGGPPVTPAPRTPAPAEARPDASWPAFPMPPPLTPVSEVLREAEEHLAAGRLWEASVALEDVLVRSQGPVRERAHVLLARACAKSPSGARRAEAELKALLEENPRSAAGYLALGQLYKDKGLTSRAVEMFRKVLSLEPGHARAIQELRALPSSLATAGGIFGRLTTR